MIFPIEIWEQIFLYSDPVILMIFKSVCKTWKAAIDKILQESTLWQRKCKAEIPFNKWDILIEKLFPHKHFMDINNAQMDSQMWMDICKLWIMHKQLLKYNITIERLEPIPQHRLSEIITYVKASRELLAIGTSEGYIYVYEISDFKKNPPWRLDHKEHICDIQFLQNERKTCILSRSVNNHVQVWDINAKKMIKKVYGELISSSHDISYILMHNMLIIEGPTSMKTLQVEFEDFNAMTATKNKVYLYSKQGHFIKIILEEGRQIFLSQIIKAPSFNIRRYYVFKDEILACITEEGLLGFSVQGEDWNIYHIFPCLFGIPTAILVYLNLLILGLDSGEIHIFFVEDFEKLDFEFMRSKRITLASRAIRALELIAYSGNLYLAVTNDKYVHIIKFH